MRAPVIARHAVKRLMDMVVAATVLLLTLPIMLLLAIAIVVESPGPVFYRASRVGHHGRPLRMLKFRKMARDARGIGLTVSNDSRLTRVGQILTRWRLDELPQFWHVLRGEMSLVGPRPEDPVFVERRRGDFETILNVRPGIAGLSQLAFADEAKLLPPDDPIEYYVDRILPQKCVLDRVYVERATPLTDARIAVWTLLAVLLRTPVAVNRATGATTIRRRPAERAAQPLTAAPAMELAAEAGHQLAPVGADAQGSTR